MIDQRRHYDLKESVVPADIRVPGDALKDRIICGLLKKAGGGEKRVLDLGCGPGHTASLLPASLKVVGIDFSREAVKIASGRSQGSYVCGDVQQLPFAANSFDWVIAKDILEHVPDDKKVLDEIIRVCRDGAGLLMYLPCKLEGLNFSAEAIVKALSGYTIDPEVGHLRRYTPRQISGMLNGRTFTGKKTWYFVHFTLGIASLLSVAGYRLLSKKRRSDTGQRGKMISGIPLAILKSIFKAFEGMGWLEAMLMKSLPGAGFFFMARVSKENG